MSQTFFCDYCGKEITRNNTFVKKVFVTCSISCRTRMRIKLSQTQEAKEKRRQTIIKNGSMKGKNNGMYGKKRPDLTERNKKQKGKTFEEIYGVTKAQQIKKKLRVNGHHNKGASIWKNKKHPRGMLGKTHSDEYKQKLSRMFSGSNNPQWNGGKSFETYPKEFQLIRPKIIKRDKKCFSCGTKEKLCVHHIDENKHNNKKDNLICLCRSCHGTVTAISNLTESKSKAWQRYFKLQQEIGMIKIN